MKRLHIFTIAALFAVACMFTSCNKKAAQQEPETEVELVETTDEVELVGEEATAEQ